ncbi:MAG: hypothetical protein IKR18_05830 [Bacteroidaceae bacterium]|nr:hypothetical protein [Bacteroidaceae bacterium]
MKKPFIYTALACLSLTSCLEDTGNYDYTQLADIEISGINESLRCVLQEPQSISPRIETTIPETNLEYCWRIASDTLAKTRDFNYTFTTVPVSSDPLIFEVRDKTNNVRYSKSVRLQVVSPFTTGWAVLTDDGNNPRLSFQSLEGDQPLYTDVYKEVNNEELSGTPVSVKQLSYQDGFTGQRKDRISVLMKGGKSMELDGVSLIRQKYYDSEFHTDTIPQFSYVNADLYSADMAVNIITADGKLYGKYVGSMGTPDDSYFQYQYNGDELGYELAPMVSFVAQQGYYVSLDEKNHRFVDWRPSSLSSKVSPVVFNEAGSIQNADLKNVPGKAVWMGNKRYNYDGNMYAVIKNNEKYYLYELYFGYSYDVYDFIYKLTALAELPDGTVDENSSFAVNPSTPYLYIGTGNKLKAINLASLNDINNAINDVATFDGDIRGIAFTQDNTLLPDLEFSVAVSNGNNSSIYVVDPTLTAHGAIIKTYSGIKGRIVSFCRKLM